MHGRKKWAMVVINRENGNERDREREWERERERERLGHTVLSESVP